eukprot:scaffold6123_cov113-Isochrysis_galbana.AAC.8
MQQVRRQRDTTGARRGSGGDRGVPDAQNAAGSACPAHVASARSKAVPAQLGSARHRWQQMSRQLICSQQSLARCAEQLRKCADRRGVNALSLAGPAWGAPFDFIVHFHRRRCPGTLGRTPFRCIILEAEPPCMTFQRCGGCGNPLQHNDARWQLPSPQPLAAAEKVHQAAASRHSDEVRREHGQKRREPACRWD